MKTVTILPSKHSFTIETNETVLDAALRQGYSLSYGCRNGACGSCVSKLISGKVEYPNGQPAALDDNTLGQSATVLCQAIAVTDITIEAHEIAAIKDIPVKTLPCRVALIEHLSHDVIEMRLKLPVTERLQFLAGQYLDFLLKDGRRRSFSIANTPHNDEYIELHIRHIQDGQFTGRVFGEIEEKDILRIEGPKGSFYIRESSNRPSIMMAGGTGIAPIKSMVEYSLAANLENHIHIYWGAESLRDLYLHEQWLKLVEQYEHIEYTAVLNNPKSEDSWTGRTGYVHLAVIEDYPDLSEHDLYGSGPPVMVYAGRDSFPGNGLDLKNYYSDAFEFQRD
ncbi:2-polyprenylphenol hydroxylase and related flavodoxin oxidoreductases / CDP-6-deoxy-delta-3,4-glucoseen reductase-like [hydrothermal vent metagenome]|uniref:2-polyprenylphenol hydroxylase and related flavodoxin oxidoreductases / CDP-6-deoxy-delta-3,4-glucoseen reductase-like n=1 Tax=hydrothermal vent metagenome TaxID=652676 RepID=A0A3B0ZME2_9ZZZZ